MSFDLNNESTVSILDELPLWSAPFGLKFLDTIRMSKVKTVLDIGSGLGFPAVELAMRFGSGTTVYTIDPWEAANSRTKWKAEIADIHNLMVTAGEAENLPFSDNQFDLIVSNNGLNNVSDMLKVLQECHRVAKKDAQLVFTMNTEETMGEFYSVFRSILSDRKMSDEIKALEKHIRTKRKPLALVDSLLEETGFCVNQKITDSFRFRYANGTTMFNHFTIRMAFYDAWQEFIPENSRKTVFKREIEKRLNHIAENKGELTLTIPFVTYDCSLFPF